MYNDRLSSEEAREYIAERMKEADDYGLQQRLGYGGFGMTQWILLTIVILVVALALGVLF